MLSKVLCTCLVHVALPVAQAGFLDDVGSTVQGAGQAVAQGAEQAGGAVVGGVQQAGAEIQELSGEALRAAGDEALQASGKCAYLWSNKAKASHALTPRLATGFQESDEDPSVDVAACERVGTAKTLAMMHQYWTDVSGLSDQIAAGLLGGGITASVCQPELMRSLKAEEPIRRSKPDSYIVAVQTTLREKVFTDAWVKTLFTAHCGEEPISTRLFALLPEQVVESVWTKAPTGVSVLACFWVMTIVAGATLLLLAAGRRRMRHDGFEKSMLLDGIAEDDVME